METGSIWGIMRYESSYVIITLFMAVVSRLSMIPHIPSHGPRIGASKRVQVQENALYMGVSQN